MGIIIEGHVVVSTKTLTGHKGHHLTVEDDSFGPRLWCVEDAVVVASVPQPRTDLPCGCIDVASHNEDLAVQLDLRKKFRIPKSTCVGCYLGDDGISIHSCAIHPERYWPEAS